MEGLKATLESRQVVLAALTTAAVVSAGIAYLTWRRSRRKYVPVGHVSKIYVHPVKSCRGLEVGEAQVTKQGLRLEGVMDRHLLVLDEKDHFVTARTEPSMVLITPRCVGDGQVMVEAPGMDPLYVRQPDQNGRILNVNIWDVEGEALDCGPEAADWLEKYFGKPGFKLVMSTPRTKKRCPVNHRKYKGIATKNDKVGFQEYTAMHLAAESSLADLNSRLADPVDMRVFRPNVVVSGSDPFQEDDWKYVRIGQAEFRNMLPCNRCLITTVDPETGVKGGQEPLNTLRRYRLAREEKLQKLFGGTPIFGITCGVEQEGAIRIGDTVYACV